MDFFTTFELSLTTKNLRIPFDRNSYALEWMGNEKERQLSLL
jgi:hypothetical protein